MNFTSQICTTREQSKRLLALGLKKDTADMMYVVLVKDFLGKDVPNAERVYSLCTWHEETSMSVGLEKREYIPAWSLHRLMEMCPLIPNPSRFLAITSFKTVYVRMNDKMDVSYGGKGTYDNLINCIQWLIGKGYFNKEYLEE